MLQVWGASIWRDLFSEFYGTDISSGGGGGGQKSVVYQNFTPSPQNKWYEKYHMKIVPSLAITIFKMDPSPSPSPNPF